MFISHEENRTLDLKLIEDKTLHISHEKDKKIDISYR
jgi:hypothetical protein